MVTVIMITCNLKASGWDPTQDRSREKEYEEGKKPPEKWENIHIMMLAQIA